MSTKKRINCTEFKRRVYEVVKFNSDAERRRAKLMSNKTLQRAGVDYKNATTKKLINVAFVKFNKHQADWEKYCRASRHENRVSKRSYDNSDDWCPEEDRDFGYPNDFWM